LIKSIIKEENFKWHLEGFASELFKCRMFPVRGRFRERGRVRG